MLATRLLRTAAAYLLVGLALGLYMGAAQDFRFTHVHAHLNLLGWLSLAAVGLVYEVRPALAKGWRAHAHYWLHSLGLALFMGGFAWGTLSGTFAVAPVAAGSTAVVIGLALFASSLFVPPRA